MTTTESIAVRVKITWTSTGLDARAVKQCLGQNPERVEKEQCIEKNTIIVLNFHTGSSFEYIDKIKNGSKLEYVMMNVKDLQQ